MATTATLTINAADIIGADFDRSRASVWVEANTEHGLIVVDGTNVRVGGRRENLVDGTATFELVTTDSADNPETFGYRVTIVYVPKGSRKQGHDQITTSDFPLTADANLAAIPEAWDNITIPAAWRSDFRDEMEAIRDQVQDISGISTSDGVVAALVEDSGSDTATALSATIAAEVEPVARAAQLPNKRLQQAVRSMYPEVMPTPATIAISAAGAASFWASRTDTCNTTSGSATIADTSITAADLGKPVSGAGIPANSYVGTVTPGASFVLSSAQYVQANRTATASGTGVSLTIGSTAQSFAYNASVFKPVGGVPGVTVGQVGYYQNNILNRPDAGDIRLFPRMLWEFDTDSLCPEVRIFGQNNFAFTSAFKVLVDGRYVSLTPKVAGTDWTASGAVFRVKIDLTPLGSTKVMRRIGFESVSTPFGGVDVGPFDTVAYPGRSRAIRAMFVGDSITIGTVHTEAFDTWAQWCARTLGWEDVLINAIGGSGYLNPGQGFLSRAGQNIYDRRETIKAAEPDVIVLAAGVNDVTSNNAAYTGPAVQAQVTALLADLAADPRTKDALIYVFGPFRGATHPVSASLEATRAAIIAAATAAPNVEAVFDPITEQWITGNGYYGTPSSTNPRGNSEVYLRSDTLHPTTFGHEGYGTRAAADISTTLAP